MNEFLQNEGPLSVTLHEFIPKSFLTKGLITTIYMVSYHNDNDQEDFTKKEEEMSLEETKVTNEEESKIHALEEAIAL